MLYSQLGNVSAAARYYLLLKMNEQISNKFTAENYAVAEAGFEAMLRRGQIQLSGQKS